jgi:hypothetical protein
MTKIQNSAPDQIAAVLRAQVDALRASGTSPLQGTKEKKRSALSGKDEKKARQSQGLADMLNERIQHIATDDPLFRQKALRCFLELVLSAEFGTSVASDPLFAGMVDGVQQRMQADPNLCALMDQAISALAEKRKG